MILLRIFFALAFLEWGTMRKLDIIIFMKCALMYLKFSQLILLDKMKC